MAGKRSRRGSRPRDGAPIDKAVLAGLSALVIATTVGAVWLFTGAVREPARGVASASTGSSDIEAAPRAELADAPLDPRLESLLERLEGAWRPDEKARLFAGAATPAGQFEVSLLNLLASRTHPRFRQAIELTASLRFEGGAPAITSLALRGPPELRGIAITASDRLGACTSEMLRSFLEEPEPVVILAALKLCQARDDRPLEQILALLAHPNREIRAAAAAVLPASLDPRSLETLFTQARFDGDSADDLVRAVGRLQRVAAIEEFLIERMRAPNPAVREAALRALGADSAPLRDSAAVWQVAIDVLADRSERALALMCLERNGTIDPGIIRERLGAFDPLLQYFAARCLIAAGDRAGVAALIDILETSEQPAGPGGERQVEAFVYATRRLLSDLSRLAPQSDLEAWRQWYDGLGPLRPRRLAAPPRELASRR